MTAKPAFSVRFFGKLKILNVLYEGSFDQALLHPESTEQCLCTFRSHCIVRTKESLLARAPEASGFLELIFWSGIIIPRVRNCCLRACADTNHV